MWDSVVEAVVGDSDWMRETKDDARDIVEPKSHSLV